MYFVPGACSLEAEVDEYMDLIITKIPKVKHGHICFDLGINIFHEELQRLFEFPDLSYSKHKYCGVECLMNDAIDYTFLQLQESKKKIPRWIKWQGGVSFLHGR